MVKIVCAECLTPLSYAWDTDAVTLRTTVVVAPCPKCKPGSARSFVLTFSREFPLGSELSPMEVLLERSPEYLERATVYCAQCERPIRAEAYAGNFYATRAIRIVVERCQRCGDAEKLDADQLLAKLDEITNAKAKEESSDVKGGEFKLMNRTQIEKQTHAAFAAEDEGRWR